MMRQGRGLVEGLKILNRCPDQQGLDSCMYRQPNTGVIFFPFSGVCRGLRSDLLFDYNFHVFSKRWYHFGVEISACGLDNL